MDLGRAMQLPVVYFVPQPTGILPPLRGLPQQSDQPAGNPLWMLAQPSQPHDRLAHHRLGAPPPNDTAWVSEDETAHGDEDVSSSDDHEHDFMVCLQNHIKEVLDWYHSNPSVVAAEDVDCLARQVHRFIRSACRQYARFGRVPAMRDVQMTSSTFPFNHRMSARDEEIGCPETPPSQPAEEIDDAAGSLTFTDEDKIGVREGDGTESSSAEEMNTISSQDTSYSCPCDGFPSRHNLWAQQAGDPQHGGFF